MESKVSPVTVGQSPNPIKEAEKCLAVVQQFELSLDNKMHKAHEAEKEYNKVQIWKTEIEKLSDELKAYLDDYNSQCSQIDHAEKTERNALKAELEKFKEEPKLYLQELGLLFSNDDNKGLESPEEGEIFSSSSDEEEAEKPNAGTLINSLKGRKYSSKYLEDASKLLANNCVDPQKHHMEDVTCGSLKLKSGYDCLFTFKDPDGKKISITGIGDNAVLAFDDAVERLYKSFETKKENQVEEG